VLETDTGMLHRLEHKLHPIISEFHQQMHLEKRTEADTNGEFVSFFQQLTNALCIRGRRVGSKEIEMVVDQKN
jgi:hypothetical protein